MRPSTGGAAGKHEQAIREHEGAEVEFEGSEGGHEGAERKYVDRMGVGGRAKRRGLNWRMITCWPQSGKFTCA